MEIDSKILKWIISLFFYFIIFGFCFMVLLIGFAMISIDIERWKNATSSTSKVFLTIKFIGYFIVSVLAIRYILKVRKERQEIFNNDIYED